MRDDYYLHTLYPLQDNILQLIKDVPNHFYLTGGTALSRAYLNHRYSDDLDFFVNNDDTYKEQVKRIYKVLKTADFTIERGITHETFTRLFIHDTSCNLKIDFINDVDYRVGNFIETPLFIRTDTIRNILSNKLTALGRLEAKDIIDIIYIACNLSFNWKQIFKEAENKDMWVNPVDIADIMEQFPVEKGKAIEWRGKQPSASWIEKCLKTIINDILMGNDNSLSE
jgi:predicted nucleotidyltransferase component of viral defense system